MRVLMERSLPGGFNSVERPWRKISDQLIKQVLCAEQGHATTGDMIARDSTPSLCQPIQALVTC